MARFLGIPLVVFLAGAIHVCRPHPAQALPQDKVDRVCFAARDGAPKRARETGLRADGPRCARSGTGVATSEPAHGIRALLESAANPPVRETSGTLYIGPGPDTLLILEDRAQNGSIIILGEGVLIVDGARLDLAGHLLISGQGKAVFRNGAHLHLVQLWVSQYFVYLVGNGSFEATDATVDANGTMHFVELHDHATYRAARTHFPDWTFRKVSDHAAMTLEDIDHVGDFLVDDSCSVHVTRCDTLMPWFQTPAGSVIDVTFPGQTFVDHFEFSDATPGVEGIGHRTVVDSCGECWWSLETFPGCSVTVRSCEIRGSGMRLPGSDTLRVAGIENYRFHPDLLVPLPDRYVRYVNTYVRWWNWHPWGETVFFIDSCLFGELTGKGGSETYATNCTHDGSTILLGSADSAFVSFVDGRSLAFVSAWHHATLLMVNSSVTPLWPYQALNIAHDRSALLCANCQFVVPPCALDTALVMVASVDGPDTSLTNLAVSIVGSAWINVGPHNPSGFQKYAVFWATSADTVWSLIAEGTQPVHDDTLGTWPTHGLAEGRYDLRLTLWDTSGDSLTAFSPIVLLPGADAAPAPHASTLRLGPCSPNPFTDRSRITFHADAGTRVRLSILDVYGREIRTLEDTISPPGGCRAVWDGTDDSGVAVHSGPYFVHLADDRGGRSSAALVVIR